MPAHETSARPERLGLRTNINLFLPSHTSRLPAMHAECCDACLLPLSLSLTSWRAAAAAMLNALLWSALSMAAATKEGRSTSCCERARAMGVYEETEFDCCRLIAPQGATAWTERENCTMLPAYTCFHNSKNKITTKTHVGDDPGVCCTACKNEKGCVSWTHQTKDHGKCELYSTVGPARSNDRDGCSAGTIGPHGPIKPAPPGPPPHPPHPAPPSPPSPTPQPVTPRGDKPNILFLVVESTDGRTWSPGYQNDAIKLPNFRELQKGGLNFRRHYANAPVCCPSRATFWCVRPLTVAGPARLCLTLLSVLLQVRPPCVQPRACAPRVRQHQRAGRAQQFRGAAGGLLAPH
eukprot:COSAG01_NODE_790_length_13572_cov_4.015587_7_plen_350_part_00